MLYYDIQTTDIHNYPHTPGLDLGKFKEMEVVTVESVNSLCQDPAGSH